MIKAYLLKHLKAALSVVVLSSTLLVFSCNNKSDKDKKDADTTKMENADTNKMNNEPVKMESDTTHKDTGKGEQTPPPK